ncbi:MAG: hypothetical protein WA151_10000 [Desulfatirhabdiaceae bacterium]
MLLNIAFKIQILGALSVGDGQKRPIPSLLPSQNHYLESYVTKVPIPFLIKIVDGIFQVIVIIHLIPVRMQADTVVGTCRNACWILLKVTWNKYQIKDGWQCQMTSHN